MNRAMRHVMWSPLPPERSGISDYSYELLGALPALTEVAAVTRTPARARVPRGVRLLDEDHTAEPGDIAVYHMGNHAAAHTWIYERALREQFEAEREAIREEFAAECFARETEWRVEVEGLQREHEVTLRELNGRCEVLEEQNEQLQRVCDAKDQELTESKRMRETSW